VLGRNRDGKRDPNAELEEYRALMEAPSEFENGFTMKAILGVLFVSFVMVPGNMYLSLMIGGSLGAAAEWVTIILFAEVIKRSFTTLKRQETYLLYYVAAALIAAESGTFDGLMYNQYLVQSPAAKQFGITRLIPAWVAPPPDSPAIIARTFLHSDWIMPIVILVAGVLIARISWFTVAYVLFRINSDYERLPFPYAPVAAQGAIALAESTTGEETWRWRVFSTGAMIGLVFGAVYVAIPAISGALLTEPIELIPIPWVDFTQVTGNFIPATPLGFTAHLGPIFAGMVMPFWGVVGTFLGIVGAAIANPLLHDAGFLTLWRPGMGAIDTFFLNLVDFWLSFGIGTTIAIAIIGIYQVVQSVRSARATSSSSGESRSFAAPKGRGDFPIWVALGLYALSVTMLVIIASLLLPGFGNFLWFFLFFGFIFTPFQSFVNARLVGLVGHAVDIPFLKEVTLILSGYKGVEIWFVPFPLGNYGVQTQKFREIELTGTTFTSIIRAEVFMVPIILTSTFLYGSYIWKLAPIPSSSYPYAQMVWRLRAYQQCLFITGTMTSEMKVADNRASASWTPSNLIEHEYWYWRVRLVDQDWLDSEGKRGKVGPWSNTESFYTHFDSGEPRDMPPPTETNAEEEELGTVRLVEDLPKLTALGPQDGATTREARPRLGANVEGSLPAGWSYYFAADTDPLFASSWIQRSTDEPWLFRALKPNIIAVGAAFGLGAYVFLSLAGLPILIIFGAIRSLTAMPHLLITEFVGAMLARYYFWNRFGKQQWRRYAPVLAVGFACGMALMGMAAIAIALIQKSVSVLLF
jgi:hypothetical protein